MLDQYFNRPSDFTIKEIDHYHKVVVVEDKDLGLELRLAWGTKELKNVQIIGQYDIRFSYQDGSTQSMRILE